MEENTFKNTDTHSAEIPWFPYLFTILMNCHDEDFLKVKRWKNYWLRPKKFQIFNIFRMRAIVSYVIVCAESASSLKISLSPRVELSIPYWFSNILDFRALGRIKRGVLAAKINVISILCWCYSPADISVSAPWRILKSCAAKILLAFSIFESKYIIPNEVRNYQRFIIIYVPLAHKRVFML